MYDHLVGEITELQAARVVLRAGGVGYELKVPLRTSLALAIGGEARLFTILHVVDGMPTLLGFRERTERDLARRLLTVSGVGPAMTLAVLSTFTPAHLGRLLVHGDVGELKRVKGIGAKTAERLCLELRDQVALMELGEPVGTSPSHAPMPQCGADAITALVTLGYAEKDARTRIQKAVDASPEADTETLIKVVLRGG
jgi:Holliday junction DNA helicase RuvA